MNEHPNNQYILLTARGALTNGLTYLLADFSSKKQKSDSITNYSSISYMVRQKQPLLNLQAQVN